MWTHNHRGVLLKRAVAPPSRNNHLRLWVRPPCAIAWSGCLLKRVESARFCLVSPPAIGCVKRGSAIVPSIRARHFLRASYVILHMTFAPLNTGVHILLTYVFEARNRSEFNRHI